MTSDTPVSIGRQGVPRGALRLGAVSALLTGGVVGAQFGVVAGVAAAALGIGGVASMRRHAGRPCYTLAAESLVRHSGDWDRCYAWSTFRLPVRIQRRHFEDFLMVGCDARRVLLPLAGLDAGERERLLHVVRLVVRGPASERPTDS